MTPCMSRYLFRTVLFLVGLLHISTCTGTRLFDPDTQSIFLNTTHVEQYATVLVGSNVVPSLSVGIPFIGILYFTVRNEGVQMRVFSTIWHNVETTVTIMLHGPAGRGETGAPLFSLVPVQGPQPSDAPVQSSFLIDNQTLTFMRAGFLYVQVEAPNDPSLKLRGQVESRNDVYVAFAILPVEDAGEYYLDLGDGSEDSSDSQSSFGNSTDTVVFFGMSLLQLGATGNPDRAVFNSWTILCCLPDETLLLGVDNTGGNILHTFGTLPEKPPEDVALVVYNDTSIRREYIIKSSPLFGSASSRLALAYQSAGGVPIRLGEYVRMPLVSESTAPDFGGRVPPDTVSAAVRVASSAWCYLLTSVIVILHSCVLNQY